MDYSEHKTTQSFPVFRALGAPRKGPLDRMLSVFADVRAGEGAGVLMMALAAFVLLGCYYLLKPVREALILTEFGAELKSYSSAGQALLLLAVVPAYGFFASKVNRQRLITWVTLFFVSHLAVFYLLGQAGVKLGIIFYIWLGIFNSLVPAQFWAFANDLYTESAGKRLFPIIGAGTSIGALAGAKGASLIVKAVGPYTLMLIAGALLISTIFLMSWVHHRASSLAATRRKDAEQPLGKEGGFQLVFKQRYLLLIALLILLLNVVNTGGEFLLSKVVVDNAVKQFGAGPESEAARKVFVGQFYGDFLSWVNLLSMVLQMFVVSRIFLYLGVRGSLFILPLIAMFGYGSMAILPILSVIRIVKTLENATDYSIQNTARHALFLPTSREAKYKAKAAIDTFFMRAGDVLAALVVFAGTALHLSVPAFAAVNFALTGAWLLIVVLITREHKKLTEPVRTAAAA